MTKITSFDLTPFYRNAIGVDRLFDRIVNQIDHAATNYPPYNIVRTAEQEYDIEIAVAGFEEDELDVELQNGELIVRGENKAEAERIGNYLHQGIASRNFTRKFALADNVEVRGASVRNGIMTIKLEVIVPQHEQPKKIAISFQK